MSSMFADLDRSIAAHPAAPFGMEGYVTQLQAARMAEFIAGHAILRVAEIGFNAGHSALAILTAGPRVTLVSFDLGDHPYVTHCADYISAQSPGRHELVIGDSADTVPLYSGRHFDLVIIDGGHTIRAAWADLTNCQKICQSGGYIIMDDLTATHGHCTDKCQRTRKRSPYDYWSPYGLTGPCL